jgi:hypothetical protein
MTLGANSFDQQFQASEPRRNALPIDRRSVLLQALPADSWLPQGDFRPEYQGIQAIRIDTSPSPINLILGE